MMEWWQFAKHHQFSRNIKEVVLWTNLQVAFRWHLCSGMDRISFRDNTINFLSCLDTLPKTFRLIIGSPSGKTVSISMTSVSMRWPLPRLMTLSTRPSSEIRQRANCLRRMNKTSKYTLNNKNKPKNPHSHNIWVTRYCEIYESVKYIKLWNL